MLYKSNGLFKKCPMCSYKWETRDSFLKDAGIELVGYQVSFEDLVAGHFLFNHSCQGTLGIPAGKFIDLYGGPIFEKRETEGDKCPLHCLHVYDLQACPVECECAYVREAIQIIKDWKEPAG